MSEPDSIEAAFRDFDDYCAELATSAAPGEAPGDRIGNYRLLQEIGSGGMGIVWMAEQSEPVQRQVALKIIKLGMDTREVVLRFEAERQALALMDHPHIARVFDGGATESGRPYFVMELVKGTPITRYCDDSKLQLRSRLELFTQVCEALQHAHQKGIIHRDVKPSNVMVTMQNGVPIPKVIDFGVAKATNAELTQKTLFTRYAQIIGTPAYMAPEQAALGGLDIDTRADVYSLGVLLYELLTGTTPINVDRACEEGYAELVRTIREVDPAKPSTRVSTMGDDATPVAVNRHVDVDVLRRRLRGDLDWIVMKALEKDRMRRYETASALAQDITRHLNDEPVVAAPPTTVYRIRKLFRRRRKTVLAVAAIGFLMIVGSIGTGIGWWHAVEAKGELSAAHEDLKNAHAGLETANQLEIRLREEATQATQVAEQRTRQLELTAALQREQVNRVDLEMMGNRTRQALLESVSQTERDDLAEILAGINFSDLARRSLNENLLDPTIQAIDANFADRPLDRAQMLDIVGTSRMQLGLYEEALEPLRTALSIRRSELSAEHPEVLDSTRHMGQVLFHQGQLTEAEPYFRKALALRRQVLGQEHVDSLESANDLGYLLTSQGRLEEAETLFTEALEMGNEAHGEGEPVTMDSLEGLAMIYQTQGQLEQAESLQRKCVEYYRAQHGESHRSTLYAMTRLSHVLTLRQQTAEAQLINQEALEISRRTLGNDHPSTLGLAKLMGDHLRNQGHVVEAEAHYREAVAGFLEFYGDRHRDTLVAQAALGELLGRQEKWEEANEFLGAALAGMRENLGANHRETLITMHHMATLCRQQDRDAEAEALFREALAGMRRNFEAGHPETLLVQISLGVFLCLREEWPEGEDLLRESLVQLRGVRSGEQPELITLLERLRGELGLCIKHEGVAGRELNVGLAKTVLGHCLILLDRPEEAEAAMVEGLDLISVHEEGERMMAILIGDLGAALLGQGLHADAEPLLLECVEWALDPDAAKPPGAYGQLLVAQSLERVVELYESWAAFEDRERHLATAAEWTRELEQLGR